MTRSMTVRTDFSKILAQDLFLGADPHSLSFYLFEDYKSKHLHILNPGCLYEYNTVGERRRNALGQVRSVCYIDHRGSLIQTRSTCKLQLIGQRPNVYLAVGDFFCPGAKHPQSGACYIRRCTRVYKPGCEAP